MAQHRTGPYDIAPDGIQFPRRFGDPYAPLFNMIGKFVTSQNPTIRTPAEVYSVVTVNSAALTATLKRAGDAAASNGYTYPYSLPAAPVAGNRVIVTMYPGGPVITAKLS